MKNCFVMKWLALFLLVLSAFCGCRKSVDSHGCKQERGNGHEHGAEIEDECGTEIIEGKGLKLGHEALASFNLKFEPVVQKQLQAFHEVSGHVFRVSHERTVEGKYRQGYCYVTAYIDLEKSKQWETGDKLVLASGVEVRRVGEDRQLSELNHQVEWIIEVPDSKGEYSLGETLMIRWAQIRENSDHVMSIPLVAVHQSARGPIVYRKNEDLFQKVEIRPGANDGLWVEVQEGLTLGDEVVTSGVESLYLTEMQMLNAGKSCAGGH